jgi:hypothetical protein
MAEHSGLNGQDPRGTSHWLYKMVLDANIVIPGMAKRLQAIRRRITSTASNLPCTKTHSKSHSNGKNRRSSLSIP